MSVTPTKRSDHRDKLLAALRRQTGTDFSGYRPELLERAESARMALVACPDPGAYLERLASDPVECRHLARSVAVNVSRFFRNPVVFEILAERVLPEVIARCRQRRVPEIRVWSAGCSTGEEPYSLAILLHQALKSELTGWRIHIFATDIDDQALQEAVVGRYPRSRLEDARLGIVDRYFVAHRNGFLLRPFVRRMVHCSREDLASTTAGSPAASVFGTFDVVLCRNVLIYFSRDLQVAVLNRLSRSLAPGGYLVLGETESATGVEGVRLHTVDDHNRIYQRMD